MAIRKYLSTAEIADQVFDRSTDWFYHHRAELRARGFPEKIPGRGFDPLMIEAWQDVEAGRAAGLSLDPLDDQTIRDWQLRLDRRLAS